MESVATLIVERLKEGAIKNVFLFSDTDTYPEVPYIIVKPESGVIEGTRDYRISVYHKQGYFDFIEKYTIIDLVNLLSEPLIDNSEGGAKRYRLKATGMTDITTGGDIRTIQSGGDTFFMERIFTLPFNI
jgi:hypothetical protein